MRWIAQKKKKSSPKVNLTRSSVSGSSSSDLAENLKSVDKANINLKQYVSHEEDGEGSIARQRAWVGRNFRELKSNLKFLTYPPPDCGCSDLLY